MNDLIWIGNTLYLRWFVIAVPVTVLLVIIVVAAVAAHLSDKE
jgi:hypothetical protein